MLGAVIGSEIILNLIVNYIVNGGQGVYAPFGADCSIFIVCGSVCIFLIFKDFRFYSKGINMFASATFAMYLFEGEVRSAVNFFTRWENYANSVFLPMIITFLAINIMLICYTIEMIRRRLISRIELQLIKKLEYRLKRIIRIMSILEDKLFGV